MTKQKLLYEMNDSYIFQRYMLFNGQPNLITDSQPRSNSPDNIPKTFRAPRISRKPPERWESTEIFPTLNINLPETTRQQYESTEDLPTANMVQRFFTVADNLAKYPSLHYIKPSRKYYSEMEDDHFVSFSLFASIAPTSSKQIVRSMNSNGISDLVLLPTQGLNFAETTSEFHRKNCL